MKLFGTLLLLLLSGSACFAQQQPLAAGYYVTNTGDTIRAQIKLPTYVFSNKIMLIKLVEKVNVVGSVNGSQVFKVNDIRGFGFLYEGHLYQFVSKDFGRENAFSASTHKFYQAMVLGPHTNFYHAITTVDGRGNMLGATYFLEKPDGTSLPLYLFGRTRPDFIKNQLKQFFKDSPGVHPLIDGRFESKDLASWPADIKEIVTAVNSQ